MMPSLKKRVSFFESEEGLSIRQTLQNMTKDRAYNTESSYSANALRYPNGLMPFVDKHLNYLNAHPRLDSSQYIANLRLMTKIR